MSRRDQIRLTSEEIHAFLEEQKTVICATNGKDGWPHLMPLWYVVRGDELWSWTYAKSQKVRNLERDPRATLQIEDGTAYEELRGVMFKTDVVIHRDVDVVAELGTEIFQRYAGGKVGPELAEVVRAQAPKRVGLQFRTRSIASWDHRKLGGVY
jgi:PPOX class probable F420-dependent enzyme